MPLSFFHGAIGGVECHSVGGKCFSETLIEEFSTETLIEECSTGTYAKPAPTRCCYVVELCCLQNSGACAAVLIALSKYSANSGRVRWLYYTSVVEALLMTIKASRLR